MSIFSSRHALTACAFATLAMIGIDASAASIRVTCEVRPGRSKISVDGKGLASGKYSTIAVSGGQMASSKPESAVNGEIEADYDSDPGDIREGATPIASTFITNASVTGKIVDATGNTVISDTVACRVKKK